VSVARDKPLEGFVLSGLSGSCGHGITLANMGRVVLEHIDVEDFSGPKIAAADVTGRGLAGAPRWLRPSGLRPSWRQVRPIGSG
jgi:hypothetical protein